MSAPIRRVMISSTALDLPLHRQADEPGHSRLEHRHLAEIDETGLRAECGADKCRPRARRADDEDEPPLAVRQAARAPARAGRGPARRDTRGRGRPGDAANRAHCTDGVREMDDMDDPQTRVQVRDSAESERATRT